MWGCLTTCLWLWNLRHVPVLRDKDRPRCHTSWSKWHKPLLLYPDEILVLVIKYTCHHLVMVPLLFPIWPTLNTLRQNFRICHPTLSMLLPIFKNTLKHLPSRINQPTSTVSLPVLKVSLVYTSLFGYFDSSSVRFVSLIHLAHEDVIWHESPFKIDDKVLPMIHIWNLLAVKIIRA